MQEAALVNATGGAIVNLSLLRFEAGKTNPHRRTVEALKAALEAAGVEFIADGAESAAGGPGVRLKGV